jgi:hypothetical protein
MIIIGLLVLLCVSVYTVVCMWSISTCLSMEHEVLIGVSLLLIYCSDCRRSSIQVNVTMEC